MAVTVTQACMQVAGRLNALAYPAYLCAMWVSCSWLAGFDRDIDSGSVRVLTGRTLGLLREAATTEEGHLDDLKPQARELAAAWDPLTTAEELDRHDGATSCLMITLEELICEIAGDRRRYAGLQMYTNMFECLEDRWVVDVPPLRLLTGVELDPDSFTAREFAKIVRMCDLLEERSATGRRYEPEEIRHLVYD